MNENARPIDLPAFLSANERWRAAFGWGGLDVRPRMKLAILTCMDSRYTAQGILGVSLGDAHVIRNAGGRVTDDAIRSLVLSAHALGTRGCVIVHHTTCGLYGTSNEQIRTLVKGGSARDSTEVEQLDFLPFDDLEESVREDVTQLRACPLLPDGYEVLGLVYDVETGTIRPVD